MKGGANHLAWKINFCKLLFVPDSDKESLVLAGKQQVSWSLHFRKVLSQLRAPQYDCNTTKEKLFFLYFPWGNLRPKGICLNGQWSIAHCFTSCKKFSTKASGVHEIKLKHTHSLFLDSKIHYMKWNTNDSWRIS